MENKTRLIQIARQGVVIDQGPSQIARWVNAAFAFKQLELSMQNGRFNPVQKSFDVDIASHHIFTADPQDFSDTGLNIRPDFLFISIKRVFMQLVPPMNYLFDLTYLQRINEQ